VRFATILSSYEPTTKKYNFMLADMKATFKLAPKIMVIQKSLQVGIFYSGSKESIKEIPREINE
jgi:hypothetical protein